MSEKISGILAKIVFSNETMIQLHANRQLLVRRLCGMRFLPKIGVSKSQFWFCFGGLHQIFGGTKPRQNRWKYEFRKYFNILGERPLSIW